MDPLASGPANRLAKRIAPLRFGSGVTLDLLRKEVIQPHLPVRLPCYDFTPLAKHTFGAPFLAVR
jgi:hypothetical protein